MDKAKNMVDKIEDKIPDSVKDKLPASVKDKLGIDDDDDTTGTETAATDLTADATAPGSVSDVAAATSSDAADTVRGSSDPSYKDVPDHPEAPGAGRIAGSDITEP
ncbi:MAG: hypothetical protein M3487_08495 [Actinomycetota bacterium]|nr:hypothetical protein [Acidimicrobiia bacterium]MDQ3469787.1 hypothetical protein [Actinomycetota bacterium]